MPDLLHESALNFDLNDDPSPLHLTDLVDLARTELPTFRLTRYTGENERVQLRSFAEEDQVLLQSIYRLSLHLYLELQPHYTEPAASAEVLNRFVQSGGASEMAAWGSQLGIASTARPRDRDLSHTIHDLRGGAFQALLLRLQIISEFPEMLTGVQTIYFLVRDHLKIMRNCVGDLDPERFDADSRRKDHDARLLVEKWSHAEFHAVRKPVQVHLHCHFEGTLCESCLEFSSLDRIIYNLMNNAARCTSDGAVHFHVLPVPGAAPENVRFVITNAVALDHRVRLDAAFAGRSLSDIFNGGFTTGGHGMGLRICADFAARPTDCPISSSRKPSATSAPSGWGRISPSGSTGLSRTTKRTIRQSGDSPAVSGCRRSVLAVSFYMKARYLPFLLLPLFLTGCAGVGVGVGFGGYDYDNGYYGYPGYYGGSYYGGRGYHRGGYYHHYSGGGSHGSFAHGGGGGSFHSAAVGGHSGGFGGHAGGGSIGGGHAGGGGGGHGGGGGGGGGHR